jgi:photosystem II stability/assembly factor-like uncharacterized protein
VVIRRTRWSSLFRFFGFLLAALLLPVTASAETSWTSRGLQGRSISSLVVDPGSPSRIYAAAGADGIYRSADGGETWTRVNLDQLVEKLEIDQRDPLTLYAIASGGQLYGSTDRGTTWTRIAIGGLGWNGREPTGFSKSIPVWSVAVDPKEPGVLHAGHSGASVSTSRDGGATWSSSQFDYYCSDFCAESITTLALDPSSPSTIYAGIDADYDYPGFAELFKSTDGGTTWKQSDTGLVLWSSVYSIAVDPQDSQRVFAGTNAGSYLSLDGGLVWKQVSASVSRAMAFDPWNRQVAYAGTEKDGVLRSTNSGSTWSFFSSGLPNAAVLSLAVDRARGLLLAGTRDGVYGYPITDPRDAFIDLFDTGGRGTGFAEFAAFGRFQLGVADGAGGSDVGPAYGPFAGWVPAAASRGADDIVRILWNNDDGSAAVWRTRSLAVEAAFLYPGAPGWTARDIAAGADGSTRLLWTAADGRVSLWSLGEFGARDSHFEYGPYTGWSAAAITEGFDGRTRILWNKGDGTSGLSFVNPGGSLDTFRYSPIPGWISVDLATGEDNQTRILRANGDGSITVWRISPVGVSITFGKIYPAPAGFHAARVSIGSDDLTRVLWRNSDGLALVWLLDADGTYQGSFPLN